MIIEWVEWLWAGSGAAFPFFTPMLVAHLDNFHGAAEEHVDHGALAWNRECGV